MVVSIVSHGSRIVFGPTRCDHDLSIAMLGGFELGPTTEQVQGESWQSTRYSVFFPNYCPHVSCELVSYLSIDK